KDEFKQQITYWLDRMKGLKDEDEMKKAIIDLLDKFSDDRFNAEQKIDKIKSSDGLMEIPADSKAINLSFSEFDELNVDACRTN
ncbi:11789_t:CDS:2, partial [Racocetra persica]